MQRAIDWLERAGCHRPRPPGGERRHRRRRPDRRRPRSMPSTPLREALAGRGRPDDLRRGGRRGHRVEAGRGRLVPDRPRDVARLRAARVVERDPRSSRRARRPRHLGSRSCRGRRTATTRSAAASTTRSPSRSPPRRSPTSCGWRRRPPTSDDAPLRRGDPRRLPGQDARLQPVAVVQLGHDRHDATRRCAASPQELGRLGFVFDFITYGGHQIDGLAAEEFARALHRGRDARPGPPPADVPPARVAVPHPADPRRWRSTRCGADGGVGPDGRDQGDGRGIDPAPAPRPDRGPDVAARDAGSATGRTDWQHRRRAAHRAPSAHGRVGPARAARLRRRRAARSPTSTFASIVDRAVAASCRSATRTPTRPSGAGG